MFYDEPDRSYPEDDAAALQKLAEYEAQSPQPTTAGET